MGWKIVTSKVTLCMGASGSGKSTWARKQQKQQPQDTLIISRDIIRQSFGLVGKGVLPGNLETEVTKIELDMLRRGIVQGQHVIVDDTNLNPMISGKLVDECHLYGVEPRIKIFRASLATLLARRTDVPEYVVTRQFDKGFPKPRVRVPLIEKLRNEPDKPSVFLFDIDGTLAHIDPKNPRDAYDTSKVNQDTLDESVSAVFRALRASERDHLVAIVSGRGLEYWGITVDWLIDNEIFFDGLLMRPEGDLRHDATVKYEMARALVQNYHIAGVFDDRTRVTRMWRTAGFKTYQVGDPVDCDF